MESKEIKFYCELRKRKDKPLIELTEEDLKKHPDKIISLLRKERVNLKVWFYVIVILILIPALLLFSARFCKLQNIF